MTGTRHERGARRGPWEADPRPGSLDWERDGREWPNRNASRFVDAAGLRWHVQKLGRGPTVLLVHGTGAATHSWRDLAPLLASAFTVVAPDLPGHGFSAAPPPDRYGLPEMAAALGELMRRMRVAPALAAGHSAGAAILTRMCLDGSIAPRSLVSLNGALLPLHGLAGHVFSPLAKVLAKSDLAPRIFAWRARDRGAVARLIGGTGSTLDAAGIELYARLLRNPRHVHAALAMMANWDLRPLARDLPALASQLLLVVGENDRTVPPSEAERVRAILPRAKLRRLPGLGHLAHEERPGKVAEMLCRAGALAKP